MKITYLGTAAAEGFPALFCNCEYCCEARRLGGKNIRSRSQAIVDDELLIDFPADTYNHFLNNNIEGHKIKYLFVTHSHSDHFYPNDLRLRHGAFAHNMGAEKLKVYCSDAVEEILNKEDAGMLLNVDYRSLIPFEKVVCGKYTVTALPARHSKNETPLFYIIEGEKTILYAHDTGYFYEEVFEYIEKNHIAFDLVSLDCTFVDLPIGDEGGHMGFDNIERLVKRLEKTGSVNNSTKKVVNHFSHNGAPLHKNLEDRAAPLGYIVSYDGLCIEF